MARTLGFYPWIGFCFFCFNFMVFGCMGFLGAFLKSNNVHKNITFICGITNSVFTLVVNIIYWGYVAAEKFHCKLTIEYFLIIFLAVYNIHIVGITYNWSTVISAGRDILSAKIRKIVLGMLIVCLNFTI